MQNRFFLCTLFSMIFSCHLIASHPVPLLCDKSFGQSLVGLHAAEYLVVGAPFKGMLKHTFSKEREGGNGRVFFRLDPVERDSQAITEPSMQLVEMAEEEFNELRSASKVFANLDLLISPASSNQRKALFIPSQQTEVGMILKIDDIKYAVLFDRQGNHFNGVSLPLSTSRKLELAPLSDVLPSGPTTLEVRVLGGFYLHFLNGEEIDGHTIQRIGFAPKISIAGEAKSGVFRWGAIADEILPFPAANVSGFTVDYLNFRLIEGESQNESEHPN